MSLLLIAGCSFHRQSRQTLFDDYSKDTVHSSVTIGSVRCDIFDYDSLFSRMYEEAEIRITRLVYDTISPPDSLGKRPLLTEERIIVSKTRKREDLNTHKQEIKADTIMIRTDNASISERRNTKLDATKDNSSNSVVGVVVLVSLLLLLLLFLIKKIL